MDGGCQKVGASATCRRAGRRTASGGEDIRDRLRARHGEASEAVEQPTRSDDLTAELLHPPTKFAICRHDGDDVLFGHCLAGGGHDRVVPAAWSVTDPHPVDCACLDTRPSGAFEDHDDGWLQPTAGNGVA